MTIEDFKQTLFIGNIYWFVNSKISSTDPHPHVCISSNKNGCVFMLCGTSQFDKKKRYFELNGIPFETLVRIQANSTNTITKDTYINCNEVQSHTIDELYENNTFYSKGKVSESELYQIKNGIEISDLIEEDFKSELLNSFPDE